ncbi:MAG: hypothetical protein JWR19_1134 [Pedosphaera sp.]|nr:hypothetical protein [Pedosphaera sp.]
MFFSKKAERHERHERHPRVCVCGEMDTMNDIKVRSAGPSGRVTAECGIIRIHRGGASALAMGVAEVGEGGMGSTIRLRQGFDGQARTRTNGDRTGIMNDKVKQGSLRTRAGGCRALRLDKVSQGGFKDRQGNLRQFKNQFFVSFRTGHHGEREYTYMRSLQKGGVAPPGLGRGWRGSHGLRHVNSFVLPALGRKAQGASHNEMSQGIGR